MHILVMCIMPCLAGSTDVLHRHSIMFNHRNLSLEDEERLTEFKVSLVEKLGLDPVNPPRIVEDLVPDNPQMQLMGSTVLPPEPPPSLEQVVIVSKRVPNRDQSRYFAVTRTSEISPESLQSAELYLYVQPGERCCSVTLSRISNLFEEKLPVNSFSLDRQKAKRGYWHALDVSALVRDWLHRPASNFGFAIDSPQNFYNGENSVVFHENVDLPRKVPYIRLTLNPKRPRRKKRGHRNRCGNPNERSCCRRKVILDFQKEGMNYIVHPKLMEVAYCSGECNPFTTSAIHWPIFAKVHRIPCCVPRRAQSRTIIYAKEDGSIVAKEIKDLVITECGCL